MPELVVDQLTVTRGGRRLVDSASFSAGPGQLIALIGENGAGKSTLLRAIVGYVAAGSGLCTFGGVDLAEMSSVERARNIAWLPQSMPLAWPNRVRDAVALGRFPHGAAPWRMAAQDRAAIDKAMADCDLGQFTERHTTTLSGGELARVHIARALASEAPLLLADEPVASLDPRHQLSLMELFRQKASAGRCILVVLHDLALAARFADRIIAMKQGRIVADGPTDRIMSSSLIEELFGLQVTIDRRHGWPRPLIR